MPPSGPRAEVTLVVPIFNEEQNVRYLYRTLSKFRERLSRRYRVHSSWSTTRAPTTPGACSRSNSASSLSTKLVRHPHNRGVAAAIMTGVKAAPTEVVCSIDCDCSYDPNDLGEMLPMIENADLVTASPYHPKGQRDERADLAPLPVEELSRMYSVILDDRMYTYTSCCRVYRKRAFENFEPENSGFLGVAETLIELSGTAGASSNIRRRSSRDSSASRR